MLSSRIVLRQRNLGEIFDLVLPFMTEHVRFWIRLSLATLVPLFFFTLLVSVILMGSVSPSFDNLSDESFWFLLLVPVAFLFAQDLFVVATSELLFAKDVSVRQVLRRYARHGARGTLAGLALGAWNTVTLLLCIGIYYAPTRAFVREAALLEGASIGAAFRRSTALTHELIAHVLGYWLIAWALPFVTVGFTVLIGSAVCEYLVLVKPGDEVHAALAIAGLMLAVIPAAIARFFMYVDLRTRKEGWDIQLRLLGLVEAAKGNKQSGVAA